MTNIRNFCIIAHIDHGKSTLADRFLEITKTVDARDMKEQVLDQMDLERERGITIKLQPVRMTYKLPASRQGGQATSYKLNLIDTPGHVDFSYEVSRSLAAVEGAILLVDATQGIQAQTLANLYQAQRQNLDIVPVINKIDLPNAQIEKTVYEVSNLLKISQEKIIKVSAKTGRGVENILSTVVQCIKSPQGNPENPLRALVFDSVYDSFRGVIAYVRIVDGKVEKGEKIKLIATNAEEEALEVGYFTPKLKSADSLQTGEIGYIVTGFKDLSQCRVGDTITRTHADGYADSRGNFLRRSASSQRMSALVPLPGYKEPQPMVFAGIYSQDGEVKKLRDAISKLKLNDSSLFFEPENSKAFGFGFRCGFLGLLHLEIIKERLEREYNLDIIITTPQVDYQFLSTSGSKNSSKSEYKEPWAKLEIISPTEYIGKIMEYLSYVRGIYKETEYLGDRVVLKYEAPLSSIIIGLYDKLKSLSSGYASMGYETLEYRTEDLVKMDIVVAGDKIDVLSQIVHRSQAQQKAYALTKRLKELLPRQMFQISIQVAVGGKILAREDVPAMRKDVTGYLYGGDVTRKRKLLEKQKKGKKKMQKLGRVDIPTDVFINLLKH